MALPSANYARWGDYPLRFPVATGVSVDYQMGDFLYWDGTQLKPVADHTWTSDQAARRLVTPKVIGVAMGNRNKYDEFTGEDLVNTFGVHKFTCPSATYAAGQMVGIRGDGAATLYNQQVTKVFDPREAIGWVARTYASATTEIEVVVQSAFSPFGPLAGRIQTITFHIGATRFAADDANIVAAYTFLTRVKVISATYFCDVAETAAVANVLTFHNGAVGAGTKFDQNLSIGASIAVGAFARQVFGGGANESREYFDADDELNIEIETGAGEPASAVGTLVVEYMPIPHFV